MFLKFISHRKFTRDQRGVTLVELLIVLALIGMIMGVVYSMFFSGLRSFHTADEQVESYSSGRMAFMNIERQIKSSEEIFYTSEDDTIFLQDLESPNDYYNYYTLVDKILRKNKITIENLQNGTIVPENTYPLAGNIKSFDISQLDDRTFLLQLTSEVNGKELELNSRIRVGVPVTNI